MTHLTKHEITVDAAFDRVFALIEDVSAWPHVFGPTVHVDLLRDEGAEQLLHIWAMANGEVRDWSSRRELDRDAGSIAFHQVVSSPPVASMSGRWLVQPLGPASCSVSLTHDFAAIGDDPQSIALIELAVDRNSTAELAALKQAAQLGEQYGELRFTFSDAVPIRGTAQAVFEFVNRADLWPQRLAHVSRIELTERVPGTQLMEMDTRGPDGSVHTTVSARLCHPERAEIRYKQLKVPAALLSHTGLWQFREDGGGLVEARSTHMVTLSPDGVRDLLGEQATLDQAREKVREALGTNSLATLRRAKEYVEGDGM